MTEQDKQLARKVALVCKGTIERLMVLSEIIASEQMIMSQGFDKKGKLIYNQQKTNASRLTTRTNRFMRMLLDGNMPGFGREGKKSGVQVSGSLVTSEKVITLPYFGIHEYGGVIPAQSITAKQRKFFWAMYYASGNVSKRGSNQYTKKRNAAQRNSMWKAMALKKGVIAARTVQPRPTMSIGITRALQDTDKIIQQQIIEVYSK